MWAVLGVRAWVCVFVNVRVGRAAFDGLSDHDSDGLGFPTVPAFVDIPMKLAAVLLAAAATAAAVGEVGLYGRTTDNPIPVGPITPTLSLHTGRRLSALS